MRTKKYAFLKSCGALFLALTMLLSAVPAFAADSDMDEVESSPSAPISEPTADDTETEETIGEPAAVESENDDDEDFSVSPDSEPEQAEPTSDIQIQSVFTAAETVTLELSRSQSVYSVGADATITVSASEDATVYYTTDGTDPITTGDALSATVSSGEITVTSLTGDGGIVTVKAVAVNGESSSAVATASVSFYRNTSNSGSDTFSLKTADNVSYYFEDPADAFKVVSMDANITGNVTLTVMKDVTYTAVNFTNPTSSTVNLFSGASGKVTLDINGKNFTMSGRTEATANTSVYIRTSEAMITDSVASGAAVLDGKENTTDTKLVGGLLTLKNVLIMTGATLSAPYEKISLKDLIIKVEGTYAKQALSSAFTPDEIVNVIVTRADNGISATLMDLSSGGGYVTGSVFKNDNGAGLSIASGIISNCVISATTNALVGGGTTTVNGGIYRGDTNAVQAAAILEDGVFDGALNANSTSAKILIRGGVYKGAWLGSGIVMAEHCISEQLEGGYTRYTRRAAYTASVSLADSSGVSTAAAKLSAVVDSLTLSDLSTVYEGERITYTLVLMPDYKVTNITYTPTSGSSQDIQLTENSDYTVNGLVSVYAMDVPSSNYTLKFTVEEQTDESEVVEIGETKYDSLSTAMLNLQPGNTLKLLKDITYISPLEFDKANITLDLNRQTLTMNVQGQDSLTYAARYSIRVTTGGNLTVTDSRGDGAISYGNYAGIHLIGDGAVFNLTGGTLKDVGTETGYFNICCVDSLAYSTAATNAKVNISDGVVLGPIRMAGATNGANNLVVSGGRVQAVYQGYAISSNNGKGTVTISGGEIYSGNDDVVVSGGGGVVAVTGGPSNSVDTELLTITGGSIVNENSAMVPVYVTTSSYGKFTIGGTAQITNTAGPALQLVGANHNAQVRSSVVIEGSAKLNGATYAVEFVESGNANPTTGVYAMPSIAVNGGYFAGGDGYPAISDTYYVAFPKGTDGEANTNDDLVLNTEPVANGGYAGYYTLTTRASLSGEYVSFNDVVVNYTYQEYNGKDVGDTGLNGILELAKPTYDAGNTDIAGKPKYPDPSWAPFQTAYKLALRVKELNRNANQTEIDFRAARLIAEIATLENLTGLDLDNLADGTYAIEAQMYKMDISGQSMSHAAVKKEATLTLKDGAASLSINLQPLYTQGLWGRLEKLYLWDGDTFAEAREIAKNPASSKRTEALYANWYAHNESFGNDGVTYRKDVDKTDAKTDVYKFPGTATITLPYRGKDLESGAYAVYLDADAMEASAALVIKWGTLTTVDVKPTLMLNTNSVSLIAGGSNNTQTVTAQLFAADGYSAVSWSSDKTAVATVTDGTITAVAAGTTTITATASKEDETNLTKTVTVIVAPETAEAASVEVATSGSTVTATLSGNTLVTNGGDDADVAVEKTKVTIDAKDGSSGITTSKVVIPASVADALADTAKEVVIQTDMGDVKLDAKAVAQIASGVASGSATLTIAEAAKPAGLAGSFTEFFDISLMNGSDTAVSFGNGLVTISVPCGDSKIQVACYISNGKIAEVQPVTLSGGFASWTTSHFSVWALSESTYTVDTGTSGPGQGGMGDNGFFLADGNYYVDIALWHETNNAASMGNVAFANNRRALVTVSGGRITNVQVATNPVDVTNIHSAIIDFRVPDSNNVTVLETAPVTTRPAGQNYNYVKSAEFIMPDSGQPEIRNQVTYVVVGFTVPDTPMDNAVDGPLTARLQFTWSTATSTSDTRITANTSTAAGTAENIDTIDAPAVNLTDSATGIKLAAPESVVPTDAEFAVKTITSGADFTKAETALAEEASKFELFEISLVKDGAEVQPNGTVTISIPIPSDYDKAKVVFYRINDDATATLIKGKVMGGDYEVPLNHFSLYALAEGLEEVNDPETPLAEMSILAFDDVADHWAFEYIRYMVEHGLMVGVSDTRFGPEGTMTRGMFVTVLGRIAGVDTQEYAGGAFDDVDEGQYYAPYTVWASQNGIVAGVGGGRFAPNAPITREQMATMLNNYVEFADIALGTDAEIPAFTDAGQISEWAADAVEKMAKAGIINGVGGDRFAPKNTATRAEVATLLARFLQGQEA